ncbi:hypothetical protein L6164_025902 [Bauhinia variegata]|uniref:Uncharacterized protein n=1 Tax=Bauhinia variegata TaxID=167791 RepID=A0ACB9M3V4_BAUVA|nr:hypothetical protein L6164_025902 [Bauhinia variegata]
MNKIKNRLEAERTARERDPYIVLHLCLEFAEQRKLNADLYHAKQLVELEAGSSIRGYILLARILSAQKQSRLKAQAAQISISRVRETAIEVWKWKIWHDLANIYTTLSQWQDAEVCLSKSQAIHPYSASRFHSTGLLHEARGLHQEALKSFRKALDIDPNHVASLISTACVLMQLGGQSSFIARSLLTDALRLDRTNPSAWYNLGLLYKADAGTSAWEAAECFEAAAFLEESSPIEPFR